MLGPDHEVPEVCMPERFEEAPEETQEIDLTVWWKQFGDPEMESYIEDALCQNLDLGIALHKVEEVRGLYRIDRSQLMPQIVGNMLALRARRSENLGGDVIEGPEATTDLVPTDFSGPLIQNFFQVGFDASWEIDIWGKNRRRAEAAYRDFEASQENALAVQITLISDVARNYIDIRVLQKLIEAKKEQICRSEDLVCLTESRYCAGLTSELDVARAKAQLGTQAANLPPLEQSLKETIHALAILLGRPPEQFALCFENEGDIPEGSGVIPADLPSELLCRRPDIRQAERELAAATSRIGVAKAEFFPSFSLLGSFGVQSTEGDQLFLWPSRFWTIGPGMVWNLFTGGRLIAQVKVANERQKQAILTYEKVVYQAFQEVEDRLVGYFKEEERLARLGERVESHCLQRTLSSEQFLSGLISLDDVLDAERDLYLAIQAELESQGVLLTQLIGLYKALGGGWDCSDLL